MPVKSTGILFLELLENNPAPETANDILSEIVLIHIEEPSQTHEHAEYRP
jgi:hypothetical protein